MKTCPWCGKEFVAGFVLEYVGGFKQTFCSSACMDDWMDNEVSV